MIEVSSDRVDITRTKQFLGLSLLSVVIAYDRAMTAIEAIPRLFRSRESRSSRASSAASGR